MGTYAGNTDVCSHGPKNQGDFICSTFFLPLPLVYGDTERENEAFNRSLPTGDSALVGSCHIRLILPPRDLSAILHDPNLICTFNPDPKLKIPFTRYLKVV